MDADTHRMLMKRAGALLARRRYSRGELRTRLLKLPDGSEVDPVLDRLEQLNLLNDADYAYNFALCRIRQEGWSPARVRDSLVHRMVGEKIADAALERVRKELDEESALAVYVRKYCGKRGLPSNLAGVRRLVTHLRQRGFEDDIITGALRQTIPAALWRQWETGE